MKQFITEAQRLQKLAGIINENTNIDSQGNIVYSLEDAELDYSDRSEILLTWEIGDTKLNLPKRFEWDDRENSIYTYIDVDELKNFLKDPTISIKKFKAPNGYIPITKKDAYYLMDSYYENFEDEINPELNEIKIIPTSKISAIKDMIAKNFPEVVKKGSLEGASAEYFPILLAVAKMNGFNFDSEDDMITYINNHSNQSEEIKKVIYGFKDALDNLNVNVTVSEMKIIPSNPQLSKDELTEKIIDLYIDLYDDESDVLENILSKYLSDRILYNANLSYKEMFETLDEENLFKLYSELLKIS
jgi:hypothetical protein